jgi:signal transduction histidine kinase
MEDEDIMEDEDSMYESIDRACGLIEEALEYTRIIRADTSAVAITELLIAALEVLQNARERAEVVFELDFDLEDDHGGYH